MQQDAYDVVTALPPVKEEPPDPAETARATRKALFIQEHTGSTAWTAALGPARGSRQRVPVPSGNTGNMDADGAERSAMCIIGSSGVHVSRGLHCPHNLPGSGDEDNVTARIRF